VRPCSCWRCLIKILGIDLTINAPQHKIVLYNRICIFIHINVYSS